MYNFNIGETIRAWNNRTHNMEKAVILNIRHNVPCCTGTDSSHIHDILYDVRFCGDQGISRSHLDIYKLVFDKRLVNG